MGLPCALKLMELCAKLYKHDTINSQLPTFVLAKLLRFKFQPEN